MPRFCAEQVYWHSVILYNVPTIYITTECPDDQFMCSIRQVDGQEPACIPTDRLCDGSSDCSEGEDEREHNCPCAPEGVVRLVDGVVPHRGRIELCRNGRWTTICSISIRNPNFAAALCRQLGFPSDGMFSVALIVCIFTLYFEDVTITCCGDHGQGPEGQPMVMGRFSCTQTAQNISQCELSEESFSCSQDFGVSCGMLSIINYK